MSLKEMVERLADLERQIYGKCDRLSTCTTSLLGHPWMVVGDEIAWATGPFTRDLIRLGRDCYSEECEGLAVTRVDGVAVVSDREGWLYFCEEGLECTDASLVEYWKEVWG